EQLGDDLFRHLEGLPVQARRGAWGYRAGRFVLRHRAMVGAALLANIALVAGIALAGYEAWQAHLQQQRAEQQRARAERHFASVRKLANVMMVDVYRAIERLPGSTGAAQLVVENALEYLKQLDAETGRDPALQLELAEGYRVVGDIQGHPYGANLGDLRGALVSYDHALRLVEPLAAAPDTPQTRRAAQEQLGLVYLRKSGLQAAFGQFKEAAATTQAALRVSADMAAVNAADPEAQRMADSQYVRLVQLQYLAGDLEALRATSDTALQRLEAWHTKHPDDIDTDLNIGSVHGLRGVAWLDGDPSPRAAALALDELRQSVKVQAAAHMRQPLDAALSVNLAEAHAGVGMALQRMGRAKEAIASHRQALELVVPAGAKDASNPQYKINEAGYRTLYAEALLALGRTADAATESRRSLELYAALPAGIWDDINAQYSHGVAQVVRAKVLEARGAAHRAQACAAYRRGLLALERKEASTPALPGQVSVRSVRDALARCA
ncbi:MAG TPA: hypothetical protein VF169_15330, partial [Albitalea sp.]|uniref:hypothetical protein n=1 Tax=Piscinibacter sp. TaxID=1903157 RepID=UPI002EF3A3A4